MRKTHSLNTQRILGIYLQKTWRFRQIIKQGRGIYISSISGSENAFEHRGRPAVQQASDVGDQFRRIVWELVSTKRWLHRLGTTN